MIIAFLEVTLFVVLATAASGLVTQVTRLSRSKIQMGIDTSQREGWSAVGRKDVLYDLPVSNHGARVRMIIYEKRIDKKIDVQEPDKLGGLKSHAYLGVFPTGKMPGMLTAESYPITESDTICKYLMDKYDMDFPRFVPPSVESRVLSEQIIRIHDIYMTPIQGCMYRAAAAGFGSFGSDRKAALIEFLKQLGIIEQMLDRYELYYDVDRAKERAANGAMNMFDLARDAIEGDPDGRKARGSSDRKSPQPYERYKFLTGNEIALADATLFPSMVFVMWMLPRFFPAYDIPHNGGYRLKSWFTFMSDEVYSAKKVRLEIEEALEKWEEGGRWTDIIQEVEAWESEAANILL